MRKNQTLTIRIHIAISVVFIVVHNFMPKAIELTGITFEISSNIKFYLIVILIVAIIYIPFLSIRRFILIFNNDSIINNLRKEDYETEVSNKIAIKKVQKLTKCIRTLQKFKDFYNYDNKIMEESNYGTKRILEGVQDFKTINKKARRKTIITIKSVEG